MFKKLVRGVCLVLFIGAATVQLPAQAQQEDADSSQDRTPDRDRVSLSDKEEISSPVTSLVDGLFGMRNRVGFAMSVTEFYTPDTLVGTPDTLVGTARRSGAFTSANSSFYANVQRSKSQFHFDYTLGYRRDNKNADLTGVTHSGSLSWSRSVGRRGALAVNDTVISATNDYGATMGGPFNGGALFNGFLNPSVLTQEIFVTRQKVTRNALSVSNTYQVGKRTNISFFASHDFVRYQGGTYGTTQMGQAGFTASHQLTKFLFLETSYTTFINKTNPLYRGTNIQRLRALSFRYQRRGLTLTTSGGVQYARNPGSRNIVADIEAGLTAGGKSTSFGLRFNRGLTSIIGAGSAFETNNGTASLTHRVTNNFSASLSSNYVRSATSSSFVFESLATGVAIQFAPTQNLVFSANHNYVSQQARNLSIGAPRLNRYASSATIHYVLPAFRVR